MVCSTKGFDTHSVLASVVLFIALYYTTMWFNTCDMWLVASTDVLTLYRHYVQCIDTCMFHNLKLGITIKHPISELTLCQKM